MFISPNVHSNRPYLPQLYFKLCMIFVILQTTQILLIPIDKLLFILNLLFWTQVKTTKNSFYGNLIVWERLWMVKVIYIRRMFTWSITVCPHKLLMKEKKMHAITRSSLKILWFMSEFHSYKQVATTLVCG